MSDSSESNQTSGHELYAIEVAAEITDTPRHLIAVYCRHGMISPVGKPEEEGWTFDDEAILKLRRIEYLRAQYGMNLAGLRAMTALMRDVEELREEVRFLRGR